MASTFMLIETRKIPFCEIAGSDRSPISQFGLGSESTVKRLRNKIGSVRDRVGDRRAPLLRFLRVKATGNRAVGKLRLRGIGTIKGGKLREHMYLCQSCRV